MEINGIYPNEEIENPAGSSTLSKEDDSTRTHGSLHLVLDSFLLFNHRFFEMKKDEDGDEDCPFFSMFKAPADSVGTLDSI